MQISCNLRFTYTHIVKQKLELLENNLKDTLDQLLHIHAQMQYHTLHIFSYNNFLTDNFSQPKNTFKVQKKTSNKSNT